MTACWTKMEVNGPDGKLSETSQWGITGYGVDVVDYFSCHWYSLGPSATNVLEMNAAMTNGMYEFDSTNGYIIPILPGTSLPEYDIEEL